MANVRDWSLITGMWGGGLHNGRGGEFYPYEKGGGGEKSKGWPHKVLG